MIRVKMAQADEVELREVGPGLAEAEEGPSSNVNQDAGLAVDPHNIAC